MDPADVLELRATPGVTRWYRGNLHAHDLWSDGDSFAEVLAYRYREAGYHFLVLSNHDTAMRGERWVELGRPPASPEALAVRESLFPDWPAEVRRGVHGPRVRLAEWAEVAHRLGQPGRFLLLPGVEISDRAASLAVHLNAINHSGETRLVADGDPVALVNRHTARLAQWREADGSRTVTQLNHPNFAWSLTAEQVMRMREVALMEVFNGHPISRDEGDGFRVGTERLWDIALTHRIHSLDLPLIFGTATDDVHHLHDGPGSGARPFRGWVEVLAGTLTPAAITEALAEGRFYASSGVRLDAIVSSPQGVRVEVAAVPGVDYVIEFIGTRRGFNEQVRPVLDRLGSPVYATHRHDPAIGTVLHRVEGPRGQYRFHDGDLYVRARVTASARHADPSRPNERLRAWTQPVEGPAAAGARRHAPGRQPPPLPDPALHAVSGPRFVPLAQALLPRGAAPGACSIDSVRRGDNRPGDPGPDTGLYVGGWIVDPVGTHPPATVGLLLSGPGQVFLAEGSPGTTRPDLADAFGRPGLEGAGFDISADLSHVPPGDWQLGLVAFDGDTVLSCDRVLPIRIAMPGGRGAGNG
ncbi:MAG: hypothetical protein ACXIUZ_02195 [Lysobacteraceae bacterium]